MSEITVCHPAQYPDFKPGQVWQGFDGDALFVVLTSAGLMFVTNRGTPVSREAAQHAYAPIKLVFGGV